MTRTLLALVSLAILAPQPAFAGKYRGVVSWFNERRGYGFIKSDRPVTLSNGYQCPNVYVAVEDVKSEAERPLKVGWTVTFDAVRVPRQTGCAAKVVEREID